jgi:excisionase family DNA binding protein
LEVSIRNFRVKKVSNPVPTFGERLRDVGWLMTQTGLSESGIRRLVRRGTVPSVRIGRRILFKPSSIERFIAERESGGDIPAKRGRRRGNVAA